MVRSVECQWVPSKLIVCMEDRRSHDYFLLLLCKSSIWFTEQHIFKITIYFFNTSKCVTNCVISFKVYDGFISKKILKLWMQESQPFGLCWAAHIMSIGSWTFRLPWFWWILIHSCLLTRNIFIMVRPLIFMGKTKRMIELVHNGMVVKAVTIKHHHILASFFANRWLAIIFMFAGIFFDKDIVFFYLIPAS